MKITINIDEKTEETEFDLKAAEARLEVVNGLIKALEDITYLFHPFKEALQSVFHQHGDCHRSHSTRHRSNPRSLPGT